MGPSSETSQICSPAQKLQSIHPRPEIVGDINGKFKCYETKNETALSGKLCNKFYLRSKQLMSIYEWPTSARQGHYEVAHVKTYP
jgi:hypothetical protein